MNRITDFFRRFKPAYSLYNLLHPTRLRSIREQYRQLDIKKTYFAPVNSLDFKDAQGNPPWLDTADSKTELPQHPDFQALDPKIQNALLHWSDNGYAIIPRFYSGEDVATINQEIQKVLDNKAADWKADNTKIMFAVRQSAILEKTVNNTLLNHILNLLLGKEVALFQSINFLEGSQQPTHSDSIHMTTFPLGYLIAVWIALEDIEPGSGVLHYYPGSHKLPYVMSPDFEHGSNRLFLGKDAYKNYEKKIANIVSDSAFEKQEFLPRKGDILIWHANLLHGGNPITRPQSSRQSMVLHYYAQEVACYHEITQRPALLP